MSQSPAKLIGSSLLMAGVPIALVAALLFWLTPTDASFSAKWALPVILLLGLGTIGFALAFFNAVKLIRPKLPKILLSKEMSEGQFICLLEPSDLFYYDMVVSLFYSDGDKFEQLIAIGSVINIQENGYIQIAIKHCISGHDELCNKLKNGDAVVIKRIRVKPGSSSIYTQFKNGDIL